VDRATLKHASEFIGVGAGPDKTRTLLQGENKSRRSVTNISVRPTFDGTALSVETHLLDFSGTISAKGMELRFWKRLRAEKEFSGLEFAHSDRERHRGKQILHAAAKIQNLNAVGVKRHKPVRQPRFFLSADGCAGPLIFGT
jgi:hypothetical protein